MEINKFLDYIGWAKCASPGCDNRMCLALLSLYCFVCLNRDPENRKGTLPENKAKEIQTKFNNMADSISFK